MTPATAPQAARLFGSVELAARIEAAEVGLLVDCAEVASGRDAEGRAIEIAGGVAAWTGPEQPFNKVAGLGFGGPVRTEELDAVERMYRDRGDAVRVELSHLADPSIAELLIARGYSLVGFENVLGLVLPALGLPGISPDIEIAESPARELDLWMQLIVEGFAHPDEQGLSSDEEFPRQALEVALTDLAAASGFQRYVARHEGVPAGGASQRISSGVAQLCGAATLPAHRRRGVQRSLLAARLAAAESAGCDLAVVATQPGSKAQQNVQRLGFDLLYTRAVLVGPG